MTKPVWRIRVNGGGWVHDVVGDDPVQTELYEEAAWWDRKAEVDTVIRRITKNKVFWNEPGRSGPPYVAEPGPPLPGPSR